MFRHFRPVVSRASFSKPSPPFLSSSPSASRAASAVAAGLAHPTDVAAPGPSSPVRSSTVALAEVPKVWTTLSQQERSAITNALLKAQQGDWKALNIDQKRALFYIAYGEYGPRRTLPKGFQFKVFLGTMAAVGVSTIIFYFTSIRYAKHPRTMSREWQEATNEYVKEKRSGAITGLGSKDYTGSGFVTSLPANPQE